MAKLRHVAISCENPEETATFYQKSFGMDRVGTTSSELADGVYLSDGVVTLALLKYRTDEAAGVEKGKDFVGVHHVGFWVDDLDQAGDDIQANGGTFFLDLPEEKESLYYEKKYRDPNGIIFDISHNGWAGSSK
jgi:catechol 2,3-dioxygenase-like lactoylglutathione lyase family enzyme